MRNRQQIIKSYNRAESTKKGNQHSKAAQSGADRTEMIQVGDQLDHQCGAGQFGCHFVAMTAGIAESSVRKSPLLVEDLQDVPALLDEISREAS